MRCQNKRPNSNRILLGLKKKYFSKKFSEDVLYSKEFFPEFLCSVASVLSDFKQIWQKFLSPKNTFFPSWQILFEKVKFFIFCSINTYYLSYFSKLNVFTRWCFPMFAVFQILLFSKICCLCWFPFFSVDAVFKNWTQQFGKCLHQPCNLNFGLHTAWMSIPAFMWLRRRYCTQTGTPL